MNIIKRAKILRKQIEKNAEAMDDGTALNFKELMPMWNGDGVEYRTGIRVRYAGLLYKSLQDHTSQPAWTPTDAPSLWAEVLIPNPEVIPDWKQPGANNGYMRGDKVRFEGKIYESLADNNIWSPAAYPAGWKEVI